jgi:hypothetical protein
MIQSITSGNTHNALVTHVVEEVEEVGVERVPTEVCLEEVVDGGLKHEGVIDRDVGDLGNPEPAWLATTGDRLVHHVVGDEEVGLEL